MSGSHFGLALRIARDFDALGIRYVVGGSVASTIFGEPRATADVDFVAELKPEHVPPLLALWKGEFYVDEAMIRRALATNMSFNVIELATMVKVDVFMLAGDALRDSLMARRVAAKISEPAGTLFVSSPEDLILEKLLWFVKSGGTSDRQWRDVAGVLKTQSTRLDLKYLRSTARRIGLEIELERAMTESGL